MSASPTLPSQPIREVPPAVNGQTGNDARSLKILLVEDDTEQAEIATSLLEGRGHLVGVAHNGATGLASAITGDWDVLVIDRLLPDLDGILLARSLRERAITTPILFVTGLAEARDKVEGLNAGGDDYLAKPFVFDELMARIHALSRRGVPPQMIRGGGIELDLVARCVIRGGVRVELRGKEFQVLDYLMRRIGQVVSRDTILHEVWNLRFDPGTNIVENTVSRLRGKLEARGQLRVIQTIRCGGYLIEASWRRED